MIAAFFKGDVDTARRTNVRLLESWSFQTGDLTPNPVPAPGAGASSLLRSTANRVTQAVGGVTGHAGKQPGSGAAPPQPASSTDNAKRLLDYLLGQ